MQSHTTAPFLALFCVLPAMASVQDAFVNWETPHVSPLALSADRTQLFAVNTAVGARSTSMVGHSG
ncbi:MAG: hypothetical protein GY711_23160 [bacterium]|nr:hypothetical protein [bacterium]